MGDHLVDFFVCLGGGGRESDSLEMGHFVLLDYLLFRMMLEKG